MLCCVAGVGFGWNRSGGDESSQRGLEKKLALEVGARGKAHEQFDKKFASLLVANFPRGANTKSSATGR